MDQGDVGGYYTKYELLTSDRKNNDVYMECYEIKITVYHVIPSEKLFTFQWSRTFHADTGDSFQNIVSLQNSFPISRYFESVYVL